MAAKTSLPMPTTQNNPFEYLRFDAEPILSQARRVVRDAGLGPSRRIEIHIDRQRHTFIYGLIAQHVSEMWCAGYSCQYQVRLKDHYIQHLPAVADGFFRTPETAQLWLLGQLRAELEAIETYSDIDGYDELMAAIARQVRQVRDRQVEFGDVSS